MYDLINIFDVFLPQLLLYPNPTDPLNGEAASLLLKDAEKYSEKVKECVKKFASGSSTNKSKEDSKAAEELAENNSESIVSELSKASVSDQSKDEDDI